MYQIITLYLLNVPVTCQLDFNKAGGKKNKHLITSQPTFIKQMIAIKNDGSVGKESACNAGGLGSIPLSGRSPGKKWQPTPVFWPGESHEQRSLADYSPWGQKSWT